ncbi:MAG: hypothetical protein ACHQ4H_03205 [Ktedonobacterales bacterium]
MRSLVELAQEEQMHREVYVAILNSALLAVGSKARLAETLGISRTYLSYLLHPDPLTSDSFRRPSLRIAERIARALPLDAKSRAALLAHMQGASLARLERLAPTALQMDDEQLSQRLGELRALHRAASYAPTVGAASTSYAVLRVACHTLIEHVEQHRHPLAFAELCFLLHDAQCVLNLPGEALFSAKRARAALEWPDERAQPIERSHLDALRIQAIRAETVALHNLGLFRQAYAGSLLAERLERMASGPTAQMPYVLRDRLEALTGRPRFTLADVVQLADTGRALCERGGSDTDALWAFLLGRSLAQAFVAYGSLERAGRLLDTLYHDMASVPLLGPLHRTLFLKTHATYLWRIGDRSGWEHVALRAVAVAQTAGLTRELAQLRRQYVAVLPTAFVPESD